MVMTGLQTVLDNIRPSFEYNLLSVEKFLRGKGLDMGCGNCPLLIDDYAHPVLRHNCTHIDQAPVTFKPDHKVDYIFSSHMVEDLPSRQAIIDCLNGWAKLLKANGHIVLLLPDMEGNRYPTVESGGNPSHRVNVGVQFMNKILSELNELLLIQIDTIPHNKSCTFDVVFAKL
jgi:hypothetical protein